MSIRRWTRKVSTSPPTRLFNAATCRVADNQIDSHTGTVTRITKHTAFAYTQFHKSKNYLFFNFSIFTLLTEHTL